MSIKVKSIKVQAFRGVPELELEIDGKSLLLRGENATGKSSIVEAFEFFFTGKIYHLEGTKGLSLKQHGTHVNFNPDKVNVELVFDPGSISLSRTFSSSPSPPALLDDYFQITQRGTFILRRSQVLTFIMSQPADRFKAIGSIIGIESLDGIELEMMRVRDEMKGLVEAKINEIDKLIKDLSTIVGKDIANIEDALPVLNEILSKATLPLIKSLEEVDKHAEDMLKAVKQAESIDRVRLLNEILGETKPVLIGEDFVGEIYEFNSRAEELLKEGIKSELTLEGMLKSSRKIIEEEKMETCPVCEQEIDREALLSRIDKRLIALRDLSEKASEIRTKSVPIITKLDKIAHQLSSIIPKIRIFPEIVELNGQILEKTDFLNQFKVHIASARDIKTEVPVQAFNQQKDEINTLWDSLSKKAEKLLHDIGLSDEEKKVLEVIRLIDRARGKSKDISIASLELNVNKRRYEISEKIYSTFSQIKKGKIQDVYNAIQGDIRRFYSILHPDEPHKNVELAVVMGKRASTELKMESFGRPGENPRALTSEGHLDSLGLCIFLGFVKKFNEGCSLIILDDVVSTIDASHREKICKLLFDEFGDRQLIITTHDEVWFEQLRAHQRAYGVEGNFKNLSIVNWDVNTGPQVRPYKPRWEKIQEKIIEADKAGAGNGGRQYLEWTLERICEITRAPIPYQSTGRYQVDELLTAAKQRLDKLIKDDHHKKKIFDAFKILESTSIMGNILSHNNILAEQVSIQEVDSFCKAVHGLYKEFLCPNCENLINYFKELKILRCSNSKCEKPIEIKAQ